MTEGLMVYIATSNRILIQCYL